MKILVVGAFGYGNIGDDTIRDVEMEFFKNRGHGVAWTSPPMAIAKVEWCDAVVLGGGGILYDGDMANVYNYTDYIKAAKTCGKKFALCNIGTQGIHTDEGKREYENALQGASAIVVRDPMDAYVLSQVTTQEITIAEDSAWGADYPSTPRDDTLGICIRGMAVKAWGPEIYANTIDNLLVKRQCELGCFSAEDMPYLEKFNRPVTRAKNLMEMNEKLKSKTIYGTRFHPLIFAVATGRKAVPGIWRITQDDKIARLVRRLGIKTYVSYEGDASEQILMAERSNSDENFMHWQAKQFKERARMGMAKVLKSLN